jgi:hypothetical protein
MSLFTNEKWQVTVTVPYFGSTGTIEFLRFLAASAPKELPRSRGLAIPKTREIVFEFAQEVSMLAFIRSIAKTFNPTFLTYGWVKLKRFDNEWDQLEAMVKGHDVYHEMSDDHRVWQSGQAELRTIKDLANKLAIIDKERVREMVKGIYKLTA